MRCAIPPAAQQRLRSDAEISGGEVSWPAPQQQLRRTAVRSSLLLFPENAEGHQCLLMAHLGSNGRSFGFRLGGQSGLNADGPESPLRPNVAVNRFPRLAYRTPLNSRATVARCCSR